MMASALDYFQFYVKIGHFVDKKNKNIDESFRAHKKRCLSATARPNKFCLSAEKKNAHFTSITLNKKE